MDRPQTLEEYIRSMGPPGPFKPVTFYNRPGDQIEWYWKADASYSEEVQVDGVSVGALHRSFETREVVGVTIYSVKWMIDKVLSAP